MKRPLLLAAVTLLSSPGAPRATPASAPLLRYGGAGQGPVVFDGRLHASRGLRCNDCHLDLFATGRGALISPADHTGAKACFACHDGQRAFAQCAGCHRQ